MATNQHHRQQQHVQIQKVTLARIDVPFWDWVTLLIKIAVAAIPAGIILSAVMFVVSLMMTVFFGSLGAVLGG